MFHRATVRPKRWGRSLLYYTSLKDLGHFVKAMSYIMRHFWQWGTYWSFHGYNIPISSRTIMYRYFSMASVPDRLIYNYVWPILFFFFFWYVGLPLKVTVKYGLVSRHAMTYSGLILLRSFTWVTCLLQWHIFYISLSALGGGVYEKSANVSQIGGVYENSLPTTGGSMKIYGYQRGRTKF